jgi:PD-(D/E)XK nuclease family transposase
MLTYGKRFIMVATKFLDPKNDFAFKQIFGTEKNKNILVHFLSEEELRAYEREKKNQLDAQALLAGAKAEGRDETIKEVAKRMLAHGIDRETVIAVTGLSQKDLNEL